MSDMAAADPAQPESQAEPAQPLGQAEQATPGQRPANQADPTLPGPTGPAGEVRRAFQAGDFGLARRLLRSWQRQSPTPGLEWQGLLDRLRPDPLVAGLIAACLLLFVVVVWASLR